MPPFQILAFILNLKEEEEGHETHLLPRLHLLQLVMHQPHLREEEEGRESHLLPHLHLLQLVMH